ncbi:Calcium uniporter protein, mitochondrial [Tetrabaena socialis]|uniref:Calcium uniporter protein, mitochondrial n=1 Tax=Tetrabaena socialis TaxID=47790 RepID=A0A2J8A0Y0_9CHLO|nr:Calcium uniporter protein, mitochondrial [Tetrabaena socialis]|eukprot:PNH06182.1 Calcium uniporter protein, mitochondrial [Tetrabaena socialis]
MSRRAARLLPLVLNAAPQASASASSQGAVPAGLQALGVSGQRLHLGVGPLHRTFASDNGETARVGRFDRTSSLLQQVQVLKLRQDLEDESERRLHIPYSQLLQMVRASGSAHDDVEAEEVSLALHRAGVILRHHEVVYLRPDEIAEMVMQALPGGKEDAATRLLRIEEELSDLEKIHVEVEKQAHRTTNRLLIGGYTVLFTQLISFIYLTWWELSWDVMEPIAYIISLFYSLLGYSYFLATKGGTFDLQPFKEFWQKHIKAKKAVAINFDEERYRYLLKKALEWREAELGLQQLM